MPGFDFSKAKLTQWHSGLPEINLFLLDSVWDQARFVAHFYSYDRDQKEQRTFAAYRMTCEPEFAILVRDEALALSIWKRRDELGLKCAILTIEDSDWVQSYKVNEPYSAIPKEVAITHYLVGCENDFFHLISKNVPDVKFLGNVFDKDFNGIEDVIDVIQGRMARIIEQSKMN